MLTLLRVAGDQLERRLVAVEQLQLDIVFERFTGISLESYDEDERVQRDGPHWC